MNKKLLFQIIFVLCCAFVWMSSSEGRATDKDEGSTGAPGESSTCASGYCHGSGGAISVSLSMEVLDMNSNPVSQYEPGETYRIAVSINHIGGNSPSAFGFQLVALADADNQSTESFSNPASNVQIATANSTGRTYAEHNGPSDTNVFMVDWTAPAAGTGSVTFYSAGNGVNGDDNVIRGWS